MTFRVAVSESGQNLLILAGNDSGEISWFDWTINVAYTYTAT
jgi:hypothetical protein